MNRKKMPVSSCHRYAAAIAMFFAFAFPIAIPTVQSGMSLKAVSNETIPFLSSATAVYAGKLLILTTAQGCRKAFLSDKKQSFANVPDGCSLFVIANKEAD